MQLIAYRLGMKVEKYAGAQLRRGGGGIVNKKFKKETLKRDIL